MGTNEKIKGIEKELERLFDKYVKAYMGKPKDAEYYVYLGKAHAIGEALDLIKEQFEKHKLI